MGTSNRDAAKRKRDRAIKQLRELGMSDEEIAAELGVDSIVPEHEPEIIDAEIVEETPNLPAVIEKAWSSSGMENESRKSSTYPPKSNRTPDGLSTNAHNVAQHNQSLESNAERRCVASNARGERCRKFAIAGSTVCKTHGGSTRHIVNKARIRVEMASNKLMGKLIEVAFDDTKPAAVQLDAIKDSLNRAGLKPREQVQVGPITPFEDIFTDIVYSADSTSLAQQGEPTTDQPHPADATQHATDSTAGFDDFPSYAPPEREQPPRRQSRQQSRQNRYDELSDEDAMRLVYEENARNAADPPPPRPMRALPRGRSGW